MNTQETNEIIKQVIEANKYMIETLFEKAPFDRTETGLVMGLNVDNSNLVNVRIGNKVYSDIPTTINVSINDVVKICVPQNNTNNMYVSGKLGVSDKIVKEISEVKEQINNLNNNITTNYATKTYADSTLPYYRIDDANQAVNFGMYQLQNGANCPQNGHITLFTIPFGGKVGNPSYCRQLAFGLEPPTIYIRPRLHDKWQNWTKLH